VNHFSRYWNRKQYQHTRSLVISPHAYIGTDINVLIFKSTSRLTRTKRQKSPTHFDVNMLFKEEFTPERNRVGKRNWCSLLFVALSFLRNLVLEQSDFMDRGTYYEDFNCEKKSCIYRNYYRTKIVFEPLRYKCSLAKTISKFLEFSADQWSSIFDKHWFCYHILLKLTINVFYSGFILQ